MVTFCFKLESNCCLLHSLSRALNFDRYRYVPNTSILRAQINRQTDGETDSTKWIIFIDSEEEKGKWNNAKHLHHSKNSWTKIKTQPPTLSACSAYYFMNHVQNQNKQPQNVNHITSKQPILGGFKFLLDWKWHFPDFLEFGSHDKLFMQKTSIGLF